MLAQRLIRFSTESNRTGVLLLLLLLLSIVQLTPTTRAAFQVEDGKQEPQSQASRQDLLKQAHRLTIIAPKYLRPQSSYHVLVSLANSSVPATIDLQLIGGRDSNREQTEAKSVVANSDETQTVKFSIGDWPAAEYVLTVNAQATDRSWNFTGEKQLIHQAKSFSGFIQTDKAIYKPGQQVQFRALFLTPSLTPQALKNELNVTIQDPRGDIIKQWLHLSNYRGLLSLDMPLSDDPILGEYAIKVEARGQEFTKQFTVAEYVLPTFGITIQLPPYATFNESDIVASVRASYTYGKPVQGHVTLTVQPLVRLTQIASRPLEQAQYRSRLTAEGTADFQVDIVKDLNQVADLYERDIEFFALVEEDLTGRKYNATQTMRIYANNVKIERINKAQTFKPGMSQLLQYKVAYQDDIPVEDSGPDVVLNYKFLGQLIKMVRLRPLGGIIEHELDVPANVSGAEVPYNMPPDSLEISCSYRNRVHYLDPIYAHQSQSNQFIQINLPQLRSESKRKRLRASDGSGQKIVPSSSVSVDDNLKIEVLSTEPMHQVACQGFARGDIVWALNRDAKESAKFEFDVKLDQRMAPEMRVLCFRVRDENKELIADSIDVPIGGLIRNVVKLSPSRDELKPGQEVEVGVFTKPNSLVGVLGIDQSVLLLKSGNNLDQKEILNDVKSYGSSLAGSAATGSSYQKNTERLFDESNVVVLTNNLVYSGAQLEGAPRLQFSSAVDNGMAKNPANSRIELSSRLLEHELQPHEFHLAAKGPKSSSSNQEPAIRIRTLFPETWLWQNGTADSQGQVRFSARVPDTITSWQLSAFSLSESHGLALSSGRTSIRVFRPFFIKLNLPYSIIRGETVGIQAIVFNYSKRPVVAKVTLDNRKGQFEFVEAANSIEDEKHSSSASESRLVNIPAEDGASVSFLVKPVKLGHVDVRVVAQGDTFGDGLVKKLLVKPPGQEQHFNKAMLVQLAGPQSTWRRNVTIEVPANAVDGSQKVFVSAVGDILGAGLSNVDDLLRLPYGCGEQNMINLVPNIVILNYLQNTKRLRDIQRVRATRNIETGYQRQLSYKRSDGSFSAFGESDANGSVWLTAYVLKTFQQAKSIVTVDESVISQAASFVARHARPDGSFEEVGMLHQKDLASSSLADDANGRPAASGRQSVYLTAYAIIALLQRPIVAQGGGGAPESRLDEVIERGLDYLEKQLDREQSAGNSASSASSSSSALSTYELAIIAYTMNLAGSKRQEAANRAYYKLWASANELDDKTWWSNGRGKSHVDGSGGDMRDDSPAVGEREYESVGGGAPPESLDTGRGVSSRGGGGGAAKFVASTAPPLKPVGVKTDQSAHLFMPSSLDVEMSSLALLTTIKRRELDRALPIVRWLVSQQNSRGGFASTQDTVLAIEALATFAEASASTKSPLSIDVEFIYPRAISTAAASSSSSSSSSGSLRRTSLDQVLISQANALVQQQTRLPDNITWVQVQATGAGAAVVQVSWQYNLLVSAERPAFYLNPILDKTSNVNYLQLSICTYYKGPGAASNMAVAEVDLPSGYVADVESLPSLKRHAQIKRIDTVEGETRVIVYLEQVTKNELCFTVPAHRSSKVSNNKPVPVTIYDYYDRKQAARIFYEPKPASSCDICDSDACRELCASKPASKRSDKLISLHEQRQARQQELLSKQQQREPTHANLNNGSSSSSSSAQPRQPAWGAGAGDGGNVTLTNQAYKYLPLAPVLTSVVGAVRRLHV